MYTDLFHYPPPVRLWACSPYFITNTVVTNISHANVEVATLLLGHIPRHQIHSRNQHVYGVEVLCRPWAPGPEGRFSGPFTRFHTALQKCCSTSFPATACSCQSHPSQASADDRFRRTSAVKSRASVLHVFPGRSDKALQGLDGPSEVDSGALDRRWGWSWVALTGT